MRCKITGVPRVCTMVWARNIISQHSRFKALMAMLHIVDFNIEDPQDHLWKVRSFVEQKQQRCKELYQSRQEVAVDEHMVKSKHRSGMRHDMPMKLGVGCRKSYILI